MTKFVLNEIVEPLAFTEIGGCILHATHRHQNKDMLKWFKALLELLEFESGVELYTRT